MRILHVNKFFDLHGGAEIYMHRLMEMQAAAGHEVHAFSTRSEKNLPSPDRDFFVTRYDLDKREGAKIDAQKALNYAWNYAAERSMQDMLQTHRPDVVHLHNLYHHLSTSVLVPIRRARIPCVQTLHDYKLACPSYKMFTQGSVCERCKGGKYWNAVRFSCLSSGFVPNVLAALEMGLTKANQSYEKTVRTFLCPSRFLMEKMQDWGEPSGKLRFMPNPTDLSDQPAPRGGGYLVYAGRLSAEKGLMSFITAAASMPDVPVKILGRGPEEERLRSAARDAGATHIEFLGFQAPAEVTRIRSRAEAVVLPSIWYENASLALLEAMGQGLPCLATRIGGNPELVDDEKTGFLVKPNDVQDWQRIIRRFQALTIDQRTKMGEGAREKVRKTHLWSTHLEQVMQCYQNL